MKNPKRKEIWLVEFEPKRGAEIAKTRPAIVVSIPETGHLPLRMIVPITDWKPQYGEYSWFVHLSPSQANGLTKESGADTFQCKSFSLERFVKKLGVISETEIRTIAASIAMCVGFEP